MEARLLVISDWDTKMVSLADIPPFDKIPSGNRPGPR